MSSRILRASRIARLCAVVLLLLCAYPRTLPPGTAGVADVTMVASSEAGEAHKPIAVCEMRVVDWREALSRPTPADSPRAPRGEMQGALAGQLILRL